MYINQLTLKNIACFANVTLDFTHEGQPCPWVVLLGENGTGKSTILQMLTLALLGRDLIVQIAPGNWTQFVRIGKINKARLDITLIPTNQDKKAGIQSYYRARFEMGQTTVTSKTGLRQDHQFIHNDYKKLDETLYSYDTNVGWFACGYGPWRRLSSTGVKDADDKFERKSQRFTTIFNTEAPLTVASNWLADLEFERLKALQSNQQKRAQKANQALKWAIEAILSGIKYEEITPCTW